MGKRKTAKKTARKQRQQSDVIIVKQIVEVNQDGEKYNDIIHTKREITITFSQIYDNFLPLLMTLNVLEIYLLFFLCKQTSNDGSVTFALFSKRKFQAMSGPNRKQPYSIGSIDNAINKLVKKNIIFRVSKATFTVNPLYLSRYITQDTRKSQIAEMLDADTIKDFIQRLHDQGSNYPKNLLEKNLGPISDAKLKKLRAIEDVDGSYKFSKEKQEVQEKLEVSPYVPLSGVNRGPKLRTEIVTDVNTDMAHSC